MVADDIPVQSTSPAHLSPSAEPPAASPGHDPEPASAPTERGAWLARLGDRIAELSARIQAATYELLVLIREFDEREGWDGCVSCAQWLSWRAGLAPGAAREHVRVARALGELPKLSDAMRRGKISYSKVRAVTRVATPDNEDDLLYVCQAGTAAHVERAASTGGRPATAIRWCCTWTRRRWRSRATFPRERLGARIPNRRRQAAAAFPRERLDSRSPNRR